MLPDFLDADNLQWLILGVLALLALAMLMVVRFVQKLVMRILVLGILAGIGISLWVQRADLSECAETCECSLYGQDVAVSYDQLPDAVQARIDAGDTGICPNIVRPS